MTKEEIKDPAAGATPVRSINNVQYTGTVRWFRTSDNAELVSGNFASGVAYKAYITLTPKTGWTLQGITANAFTVENATSATNAANAGLLNVSF